MFPDTKRIVLEDTDAIITWKGKMCACSSREAEMNLFAELCYEGSINRTGGKGDEDEVWQRTREEQRYRR
jgi:hypothetical protein